MRIRFFFSISLILLCMNSYSQSHDFIILPKGDTTYGESYSLKGDMIKRKPFI